MKTYQLNGKFTGTIEELGAVSNGTINNTYTGKIEANDVLSRRAQTTAIHAGLADLYVQGFNSANRTNEGHVTGGDRSANYSYIGDVTGGDNSANRTNEGDVIGGNNSANRAYEGDVIGGNNSANRAYEGHVTGGHNSANRTNEGHVTGGDNSANRTNEGHVTGGDNSVNYSYIGDVTGGIGSLNMGTRLKIGAESVGVTIDANGWITGVYINSTNSDNMKIVVDNVIELSSH